MRRGRGTGGAGGANAPPKFQILLIKFCRKTIFKFFHKVRAPPIQNCFRGPCECEWLHDSLAKINVFKNFFSTPQAPLEERCSLISHLFDIRL